MLQRSGAKENIVPAFLSHRSNLSSFSYPFISSCQNVLICRVTKKHSNLSSLLHLITVNPSKTEPLYFEGVTAGGNVMGRETGESILDFHLFATQALPSKNMLSPDFLMGAFEKCSDVFNVVSESRVIHANHAVWTHVPLYIYRRQISELASSPCPPLNILALTMLLFVSKQASKQLDFTLN